MINDHNAKAKPEPSEGSPAGKPTYRLVGNDGNDSSRTAPTVPIALSEFFPLIAQAYHQDYRWLDDWSDEPVMVSADLAQLLAQFQKITRSKSA